jgi:hypothetical protein
MTSSLLFKADHVPVCIHNSTKWMELIYVEYPGIVEDVDQVLKNISGIESVSYGPL